MAPLKAWGLLAFFACAVLFSIWVAVYTSNFGTWGGLLGMAIGVPRAVRDVRGGVPTIAVADDGLTIRHPGYLRAPITIRRAELHSIAPVWLRPHTTFLRPQVGAPVAASRALQIIGADEVPKKPALVFVYLAERGPARKGSKQRGVVVAVEDLDAAQQAFQPWGLLARLTPGAFDWLLPRSTATSPGPLPVYGT